MGRDDHSVAIRVSPSRGMSRAASENTPRAESAPGARRRRTGQLHHDAEPPGGSGREGEVPVVCLGDALDDRQAEADARVVVAYTFAAALERLGECRDQLLGELLAA